MHFVCFSAFHSLLLNSSENDEKVDEFEDEMTALRSFAFLAFLMLVFFSSSMGTTTRAEALEEEVERDEGRSGNNLIDPFRSTSCLDAQMYCEQTIAPAVDQDASLGRFLREERKEAERTQSWEAVVPEERMKAMKVPETLALGAFVDVVVLLLCILIVSSILTECSFFHTFIHSFFFLSVSLDLLTLYLSPGCCLLFGECAAEAGVQNENQKLAARMLEEAANSKDKSKQVPEITFLAANAHVCAERTKYPCDSERVKLFRKASRNGFHSAALTAAEILITRYGGEYADKEGACGIKSAATGKVTFPEANDPADAVVAKSLLKPLLATSLDRKAKTRLKELEKIEEKLIGGGKLEPDVAMQMADVVVDIGIKVLLGICAMLVLFKFRETKYVSAMFKFLGKITGVSYVVRFYRFLRGDFEKSVRVNAGRAGSRAEIRAEAKRIAKEMYKKKSKKET